MKRVLGAAAVVALFAGAGVARADEVFVGAYAHDVNSFISHGVEHGQDIEGGYQTAPMTGLSAIGRPIIYAEYLGNTAGRTSFGAIGFRWRKELIHGRLYGQIGLGGALHDGVVMYQDPYEPGISTASMEHRLYIMDTYKAMGSRLVFNPNLALGVRLSSRLAVEAVWNHFSNAGLGQVNPGLDDFGGRLVFRFGPTSR